MSVYDPTTASDQGRNVRDQGNNQNNPFGFGGQGYGAWERSYNLNPDFGWARNQGLSALDFRNRVLENNPAGGGGQNMELANMLRDIGVPDYVGSEGWDRWTNEFGQGGDWGWMQDQGIGPAGALEVIRRRNPDHWTRQFFMDNIVPDRGQDQVGGGGMESMSDQSRSGGGGGGMRNQQRFQGGGPAPGGRTPRMPSPPQRPAGLQPKIPPGFQAPPGGGASAQDPSQPWGGMPFQSGMLRFDQQGNRIPNTQYRYGPGGQLQRKPPGQPWDGGAGPQPGGGTPAPPQGRPQINPQVAQAIMMLMNGRRPGGRGGAPRGGGAPRPMGPNFGAGRRRDTPFFFF